MFVCVVYGYEEVCKPNNATDHRQAMTEALMQRTVTDEHDSPVVSSDEQQPIDDDLAASLDTAELPKEDL